MRDDEFLQAFLDRLRTDCLSLHTDNVDFLRYPVPALSLWKRLKYRLKRVVIRLAGARGFLYLDPSSMREAVRNLAAILSQAEGLGHFYELLRDERSRQFLIALLAFRVLGNQRVKLPSNNADYWACLNTIETNLLKRTNTIPIQSLGQSLNYYELDAVRFPIRLHAQTLNILNTFLLQQYACRSGDRAIQVEAGDVVIDAGGCWGDTALYFAHRVGRDGNVFCFEFSSGNLPALQENLDMNRHLKDRIEIVTKALWESSTETLSYLERGPGTRVVSDPERLSQVQTEALDDFVRERALRRVDFIKMDIEGAELRALKGAEQTIRSFRPKLAIAVYHKDDDLITIPSYLEGLGLGYEFCLDHFSIHDEETILFARQGEK